MLVSQGLAMLSISAPVMGRMETVHPVLLWDDQNVALVDTGFPGQSEQLRAEVESYPVHWNKLNRIILTHQDIDHIGNVQKLAGCFPSSVEVSAHKKEKPYIQGDRRLIRFTDEAIARLDQLPRSVPESFRLGLKSIMLNPPRANVDRVIADGDRLPWCGGLIVVETPGHTPGHISLYHEPSRTLIAGDALVVRDGMLYGADFATTLDMPTAQASVAKLLSLDIAVVVCYHGGLYKDNVMERLAVLAKEL